MKILEKIIEYGLYLFVFLLPWQTRLILRGGDLNGYWEYGTISIYATEILLWAIFVLAATWWIVNKIQNPKSKIQISNEIQNPKSKSAYLLICLFAFLLYSLVSILWSDSRSLALYVWHWLAEAAVLFLILRAVKFDLVKLAWAFVASAIIQAGLGTWQFLSQSTFSSKWLGMALHDPQVPGTFVVETALRRWLRAYGSLPHPNMLAGFLSVAMFLSIWLYQKIGYGFKKLFLPAVFAVLSFGLCATFSKSVIASFLLVLILWWIIILARRQSKEIKINLLKFTLVFLVIAAIFGATFWEPVQTRIIGAERLEIKSTTERLSYFGEAWQLIKNHPLIGAGLGNYTLAVHNEINPNLQAWDYQPVHNIYLLILAELGIIGFILWLALIFILIKNLPVIRRPLFIMLLFIGLFDHYFWTLYFGIILFWLVFGAKRKDFDTT
ncbi:O-antigen ligase family protein [Candidatus Falkowbacteria bacterium]|nr:O-antigen ligase family protein [Candidatus Falkowbacteria bacterium]